MSIEHEEQITVLLEDQFYQRAFEVKKVKRLCNPVEKTLADGTMTETVNFENHLTCYEIALLPGICEAGTRNAGQSCAADTECCATSGGGQCDGGINLLKIMYTGSDPVTFTVDAKDIDSSSEGPHTLNPGDMLELLGKDGGVGKLGSTTRFFLEPGGEPLAEVHTSCSKDIYVGMAFDLQEAGAGFGPFVVVEGTTSIEGGLLGPGCDPGSCVIQSDPEPGQDPLYLTNQFGDDIVQLKNVKELCVPSQKTLGSTERETSP
jgi:hypothetical protein